MELAPGIYDEGLSQLPAFSCITAQPMSMRIDDCSALAGMLTLDWECNGNVDNNKDDG